MVFVSARFHPMTQLERRVCGDLFFNAPLYCDLGVPAVEIMHRNMHREVSIFKVNVMLDECVKASVKGLRQRLINLLKFRAGVSMESEHAHVLFCQLRPLEN